MSASKSRIKMRPPRNRDSAEVSFDKSWVILSTAMEEMYRKNASRLSYEELYRTAYTLVLRKYAERLYNAFKAFVAEHLCAIVNVDLAPLTVGISTTSAESAISVVPTGHTTSMTSRVNGTENVNSRENGQRFLNSVKAQWDDHCLRMRMISDILMYMDRVYCRELQLPLVYDAGLSLFRDNVIRNPNLPIDLRLYSIILDQIHLERNGDMVDTAAIKATVLMLESLSDDKYESETVYSRSFEPLFLSSSVDFYRKEAEKLLAECDSSQYFWKTERRLVEEYERTTAYLSANTETKITKIVEENLITRNLPAVMRMENSGVLFMIENNKFDDLRRLYRLCNRVDPDKTELKSYLAERIVSQGLRINDDALQDMKRDVSTTAATEKSDITSRQNAATRAAFKWVESVLSFKELYDRIIDDTMNRDIQVQTATTNAFSVFINKMDRASEFLSLYIDENLKKGLKGKTEDEVEATLDRAIVLFRYISDKDMFETYYKAHLAKRLLGGRSVSDDAERMMIGKLKMEVGYSFTTKLEGMFKDMKISKDIMQEYKRYIGEIDQRYGSRLELSVNVLTSNNWPVTLANVSEHKCVYPAEIELIKSSFERFYKKRHSGRSLTWNPNMGNADVTLRFKVKERKREHDLNVSTYAMVILMLFNDVSDDEFLSFEQIKQSTLIPEIELIRNLQSLAVAPKSKILLKEPKSKDVKPTDKFCFNKNFESKLRRIAFPTVAYMNKTETESERRDTMDKVEQLRRYQTDAAIVRIMKARKVMEHNLLVAEVTAQLTSRFQPNASLIKKRIDAMLEREYIERSADNRQEYHYLVSSVLEVANKLTMQA
ncbi:Cullin [Dipodascopsis tothii]|uniref:Cullin n=1 Tax=Dipodascopsis tothii TaxID=44089 RepID=UPI0034CE9157